MQTAYLLSTCSAANCSSMVVESPDPTYISIDANKLQLANCDEVAMQRIYGVRCTCQLLTTSSFCLVFPFSTSICKHYSKLTLHTKLMYNAHECLVYGQLYTDVVLYG